jgi:hypothetical protein
MSKESTPHVFKAHGDLQDADHVRTVKHLWAPPGATIDQVTDVKSFTHIAHNLKPNDEIIIRSEDDAFYCRVLVRMVSHLDVVVTILDYFKLKDAVGSPVDSEFEVKYINGRYKWGFKRIGDNEEWIVKELQTEQAAMTALADHRKTITL